MNKAYMAELVRLGRDSDANTAQKMPKKLMRYQPTEQPTN